MKREFIRAGQVDTGDRLVTWGALVTEIQPDNKFGRAVVGVVMPGGASAIIELSKDRLHLVERLQA